MTEKTMLQETYELLDACELTYREICTGADIGYHWLNKFKCRGISDPGIERVERLYRFLREQKALQAAV